MSLGTSTPSLANESIINGILGSTFLVSAALIFLAVIIFFIIFRKPISGFIDRIVFLKWKSKNNELQAGVDHAHKYEDDDKEKKKEEQMQEIEDVVDKKNEKVEDPKTIDDWRLDMIIAAIDKKRELVESSFQELMKLNQDYLSRKSDDVLRLRLLHTLGDTGAIIKLREFLDDSDINFEVNTALGYCYSFSNDLNNASLFFSKALYIASTENDKTSAATQYSEALYANNKTAQALDILVSTLFEVSSIASKVKIYESMADIYEKEKDYENRALIIDKAIELMPNDEALIFKAGYSYAESNYNELSLLHYKNAKLINPDNEAVQNNLGVQYDDLNMPIKSIESYRKADSLGNTLASANMAYRLMKAGFISEASKILNTAKDKEDVHPNVNSALAEISKKKENEDKIEVEKIKIATRLREFFSKYTDAKLFKSETLKNAGGIWQLADGTMYELKINDNILTAYWKNKRWGYEYNFKFEGAVINNSCTLEIYEEEYNSKLAKNEYKKTKDKGFLFYSPTGDNIQFIKISENHSWREIFSLSRIEGVKA